MSKAALRNLLPFHPLTQPTNVRKRKRRTVKNAYVDLDSVTTKPGIGYANWIPITKQKLKQRECQLLSIKITKIEMIVSEHMMSMMMTNNYKIPRQAMKSITDELFGEIDGWNGVNLCRVKKRITAFRDYYNIGKRWWDLRKTRIFGSVFWLRVFADLQQKITKKKSALLPVIRDLFAASIQYSNTKPQRLINSGVLRKCEQMKQYLISLDGSLDIAKFAQKQKNQNKSERKSNEFIMEQLRSALCRIANEGRPKKEIKSEIIVKKEENASPINQPCASMFVYVLFCTYM